MSDRTTLSDIDQSIFEILVKWVKENKTERAGFFELLGYIDTKAEDRIELWLPLLKQAYEYENWDELLAKAKTE